MARDSLDYDTLLLKKLRVGVTQSVSAEFAATCKLNSWQDPLLRSMVYALEGFVLAEKLAEKTIVVNGKANGKAFMPASPFQHWKQKHSQSWWLGWFVARRPVRETALHIVVPWTRKVKTQQFATFPASPIRTPEKLRGPIVVRQETTEAYQ